MVLNGKELEREDALRVCGRGWTAPPNPNHPTPTHAPMRSLERSMWSPMQGIGEGGGGRECLKFS